MELQLALGRWCIARDRAPRYPAPRTLDLSRDFGFVTFTDEALVRPDQAQEHEALAQQHIHQFLMRIVLHYVVVSLWRTGRPRSLFSSHSLSSSSRPCGCRRLPRGHHSVHATAGTRARPTRPAYLGRAASALATRRPSLCARHAPESGLTPPRSGEAHRCSRTP